MQPPLALSVATLAALGLFSTTTQAMPMLPHPSGSDHFGWGAGSSSSSWDGGYGEFNDLIHPGSNLNPPAAPEPQAMPTPEPQATPHHDPNSEEDRMGAHQQITYAIKKRFRSRNVRKRKKSMDPDVLDEALVKSDADAQLAKLGREEISALAEKNSKRLRKASDDQKVRIQPRRAAWKVMRRGGHQ